MARPALAPRNNEHIVSGAKKLELFHTLLLPDELRIITEAIIHELFSDLQVGALVDCVFFLLDDDSKRVVGELLCYCDCVCLSTARPHTKIATSLRRVFRHV